MNRFEQLLSRSNSQIREGRAKIHAENAKFAQEEVLRKLQSEKRKLETKLTELTDISRDSELSLRVTRKDFDAEDWANQVQNVKVELANKDIEVQLAQETLDEWFGDLPSDKIETES